MSTDADAFIFTASPTARQRSLALKVLAAVILAYGAVAPYSSLIFVRIPGYLPAIQGMMGIAYLLTAILLYSQFSVTRSRAVLVLASGYAFTALIIVYRISTYPSLLLSTGIIGPLNAVPQAPAWLYIIWHLGFPVAASGYIVTKSEGYGKDAVRWPAANAIFLSSIIIVGLVLALAWAVTAWSNRLPDLVLYESRLSPLARYILGAELSIVVSTMLLLRARQTSVLDQWLMVSLGSMAAGLALECFVAPDRYSLGSYANALYGLISSLAVLAALHAEVARAYSRTLHNLSAMRHDHANKLMGVQSATGALAHEIRQPLTAIELEVGTARLYLRQKSPNLEEIRESLDAIALNARRANEVIASVRNAFKGDTYEMKAVDLNELVAEAVGWTRGEFETQGITAELLLAEDLPKINGYRDLLLQVLINVLRNAVDALDNVTDRNRVVRIETEGHGRDRVAIKVEDSGPGIDPKIAGEIFDSFKTTKTSGMGLGLVLCRTIVEQHGGEIVASSPGGARFEIFLPIA